MPTLAAVRRAEFKAQVAVGRAVGVAVGIAIQVIAIVWRRGIAAAGTAGMGIAIGDCDSPFYIGSADLAAVYDFSIPASEGPPRSG